MPSPEERNGSPDRTATAGPDPSCGRPRFDPSDGLAGRRGAAGDPRGDRQRRPADAPRRFDHHANPWDDHELAVGFLFTEGLIADPEQVAGVQTCGGGNVVRVDLAPGATVDLARLERHFYTGSSCGVCGKASLAAVRVEPRCRPRTGTPVVEAEVIHRLPDALRAAQVVFDRTGGLHASALFDPNGRFLGLREDVGRHNALDKLIGAEFLAGRVAALGRDSPGERAAELRAGAEGGGGRRPGPGGGRCPVEPRGGSGARARPHRDRLPPAPTGSTSTPVADRVRLGAAAPPLPVAPDTPKLRLPSCSRPNPRGDPK